MTSVKSTALSLVIAGFALTGCVHSGMTPSSPTAKADMGVLKACLFKSSEDMMKSPECTAKLAETHTTADDVATIKSCKAMSHEAMNASTSCKAQMLKHPGVL
jgi:hypothetical protein